MKIIPVLCGSAFKNKGVQQLLDGVVDFLPSPIDIPPVKGMDPNTGKEVQRTPSDTEPFSALAFKIMTDPFAGQLTYFRVYSGTLKTGTPVSERDEGDEGSHRPPAENACQQARGNRCSAMRGTSSRPWDSRGRRPATRSADEKQPVLLEVMKFPEPVIAMAIEPKTKQDQEKMGFALQKLGAGRSVVPGADG